LYVTLFCKYTHNEQYKIDATKAQQLTRKKDGVTDMWMFRNLHYQRIDINIYYDPFHVLSNFTGYILKLFLGLIERDKYIYVRVWYKVQYMHPKLWRLVDDDVKIIVIDRDVEKLRIKKQNKKGKTSY
jgi:hypothetical protein